MHKLILLFSCCALTSISQAQNWSLTGNSGTNVPTNFLGTTDNVDLIFKRNNIISGVLGYNNLAFGQGALSSVTTGYNNIMYGTEAGFSITSGINNVFIGFQSGMNATVTSQNTFLGNNSGNATTTGASNTFLGYGSGTSNTTGNSNVFIGLLSGRYNSSGSNNIFIGESSGESITTGSNNTIIGSNVTGLSPTLTNNIILADGSGNQRININGAGNVGIGTDNPTYKLNVVGNALVGTSNAVRIDDGGISMMDGSDARSLKIEATKGNFGALNYQAMSPANTAILNVGAVGDGAELVRFRNISNQSYFSLTQPGYNKISAIFVQDGVPQLYLEPSGNIGINTSTPNTNAKLDVNGNIFSSGKILIGTTDIAKASPYALAVNGSAIFTKAIVKLESNWPDYVFEPAYQLPSLKQVETYLKENKHLQGVPSADEVKTNGIDLGDNQAILLKKMEEMTLYMIELNKKIEALTKENETLRTAINSKNN